MQTLTIAVKTEEVKQKILLFLKGLEQEGVEIITQEDKEDLELLIATRGEEVISFEDYLKNED